MLKSKVAFLIHIFKAVNRCSALYMIEDSLHILASVYVKEFISDQLENCQNIILAQPNKV